MNVLSPAEPPVNRREILRYAGCRGGGAEGLPLEECLRLSAGVLSYRVVWETFPVSAQEDTVDLGFARVRSAALARSLAGCGSALVFAATVGLGMDRLIARYERVSPSTALLLHAVGTERIESLCDAFCRGQNTALAEKGLALRPRFSPGYGDLPLAFQREIFRALECEKRIGLTLTDSLLMSPAKSVTAIAGIASACAGRESAPCAQCGKADCAYRG